MTAFSCPVCGRSDLRNRVDLQEHAARHSPIALASAVVQAVLGPPCEKRTYDTENAALLTLREIWEKAADGRHPNRRECRPYYCPRCGKWHLTSLPGRTLPAPPIGELQ